MRSMFLFGGLVGASLAGACDTEEPAGADQERSPIGKADATAGSCEDRCGEVDLTLACQCDEQCSTFGDCCADIEATCGDAGTCDPDKFCTQAITCVDGQLYPTGCGPTNCDEPLGPCDGQEQPECDPTKICTQAITCVDGQLYPTGCGPTNCDEPLGTC